MATTIQPSIGAGLLWTQQGVGTTPGYSAADRRRATNAGVQEGVIGPLDFKVAQRGAGANMSVDVGMPAGGEALVQGDAVTGQGLYTVPCHSATVNEAVTAAHATLPRIDQVLLRVRDNTHDASGVNAADVFVLAGTATSGATRDNRAGAAELPGSCMRLADVLVSAGATTVVTANIRDRRSWARGAFSTQEITSGDISVGNSSYGAGGTLGETLVRIECTGSPVRVTAACRLEAPDAINLFVAPFLDGVVPSGLSDVNGSGADITGGMMNVGASFSWTWTPAAGSHTFQFACRLSAGVGPGTIRANASTALLWTIEELVRQNASNG